MPLLRIQTNVTLDQASRSTLAALASQRAAELLGKNESYVMVSVETGLTMLFSGNHRPLAYLELKSAELPAGKTRELSAGLCNLIHAELGIAADRVFIEFADVARGMWGWNNTTLER
ncbi:MAG: hypothetical protein KDI63_14625 [Gammaproteobacteria bacterium]|nr:hypothetical protein [Gammaproteobacteria bacterium]